MHVGSIFVTTAIEHSRKRNQFGFHACVAPLNNGTLDGSGKVAIEVKRKKIWMIFLPLKVVDFSLKLILKNIISLQAMSKEPCSTVAVTIIFLRSKCFRNIRLTRTSNPGYFCREANCCRRRKRYFPTWWYGNYSGVPTRPDFRRQP